MKGQETKRCTDLSGAEGAHLPNAGFFNLKKCLIFLSSLLPFVAPVMSGLKLVLLLAASLHRAVNFLIL